MVPASVLKITLCSPVDFTGAEPAHQAGPHHTVLPDSSYSQPKTGRNRAVFFKAVQVIAWRELQDESVWWQGWV